MRTIIIVLACFAGIALSAEAFTLPDLFVTAKNEVRLDAGARVTEDLKEPWRYHSFMAEPWQARQRENVFLQSIGLIGQNTSKTYNEVRFGFGLPTFIDFGLYHAGTWDKRPYVLSLDRLGGGRKYAAINEESGLFWGAIGLDDVNVIDVINREHNIGLARLSMLGVGWSTIWQVPLAIKLKLYNSNAYAGNVAASYLLLDVAGDVGPINLLESHFPTILRAGILNSRTNSGIDLRADLAYEPLWFDIPQKTLWNVGLWSNAGSSKFIFGVKDNISMVLDRHPAKIWLDWSTERPDLDTYLKPDFVEMPDSVFVPDEKFSLGTSVEGLLRLKDTVSVSWTNFINKKAWNDPDSDGYYTYDSFGNVSCLRTSFAFKDIRFLDDVFDATVGIPLYSREIPNQFDKWADLAWRKSLWGGEFVLKGNVWMRELGSTTGLYKSTYFDMEGSFDQALSSDFSWGIRLKNLFSQGQERMSGHLLGDPILSFQVDMVF